MERETNDKVKAHHHYKPTFKLPVKHEGEATRFSVSTKRGKGKLHPLVSAKSEALKNKK